MKHMQHAVMIRRRLAACWATAFSNRFGDDREAVPS